MQRFVIASLLLILFCTTSLAATQGFTCNTSTRNDIVVEWTLPGYTLNQNGETVSIEANTSTWTGDYGSPSLPLFSTMAALPETGACTLEWEILEDEWLSATPEPYREADAPLWFDPAVYEGDNVYPAQLFTLSEPGIMRNKRVAGVRVSPFCWHPGKGLQIIRRARLTIHTNTSTRGINELTSSMPASRTFEDIFSSSLVNYSEPSVREDYQQPCILFITSNSTVQSYIGMLTLWKHTMGYEVHTTTMSTAGSTNSAIKSYIQTAYDTWANPPEFVVLVGDASGTSYDVPTWYHSFMRYNGEGDHPYTLLDGTDQIEDICIGRLSFSTTTELQTIVAKILGYERDPYMDTTDWYTDNLLVGDTDPSGVSCISTNKFVKEVMTDYNAQQSFTEIYGPTPSASAMNNALNAGTLYFNYRGWYGMSGWTTSNISSLTNYDELPVSVIITCDTGSFASGTARTEAMLRRGTPSAPAGGICAVGMSTTGTHTAYNNCLDGGIFEGLFEQDMRTIGQAVQRGKTYLWQTYNNSQPDKVQTFSHICNLMGDPSLQVWKGLPANMTVNYLQNIPPSAGQLVVRVMKNATHPIANAWVTALQGNDTIFATGYTDEDGYIMLPIPTGQSGTVDLTVTSPGYKPHLGSFNITSATAGLTVSGQQIDDDNSGTSSGNDDGVVNPGEHIELKLQLRNIGNSTLSNVTATLSALDRDWVNITDNSESFGTFTAGQSRWCTDDYDITIDPACPGGTTVRFLLQLTSGLFTMQQIVELQVSGPALEMSQVTINDGNGVLDPGDTSPMLVRLANNGTLPSAAMTATISSHDSRLQFTTATASYASIAVGNSAQGSPAFVVHADEEVLPGSVITIDMTLSGTGGEQAELSFPLTVGNPSVTDPVGPDSYGYAIYGTEDTTFDLAPLYDWVEIDPAYGGNGTNCNLTDNGEDQDDTVTFNLPFSAMFYGKGYSQVSVCSNGWFSFGATEQVTFRNWRMPGPLGPEAQIAVFWDDLRMANGDVFYKNDTANHRYIIEWSRVQNMAASTQETFQAIIYNPAYYPTPTGDCEIKLQYMVVNNIDDVGDDDHGCYATVGIEDHTGLRGIEYTFDNEYPTAAAQLADGLALFITTRQPEVLAPPDAVVNAQAMSFYLQPDNTGQGTFSIANQGEAALQYSISSHYVNRNQGGPDTFGYMWKDSNEPNGPTYQWEDIQSQGTEVTLSDDELTNLINIGFSFPFYGADYTQLRISSNGYVTFNSTQTDWENDPIPDSSEPNCYIAPFWDDLSPQVSGSIHYWSDVANERFIVQYTDVDHYHGTWNGVYCFQMQLYSSGNIWFFYEDMTGDLNTCTIGIENADGTDGLQVAFDENYIASNMAIRISTEPEWLDVTPQNGILENGQSVTVQVDIDTSDMNYGDYARTVEVATNDPNQPLVSFPVTLHVVNQILPPRAPANIRIARQGSGFILRWDAVTQDTGGNNIVVEYYNVYRSQIGSPLSATPDCLYGTTTSTLFADSTPGYGDYLYMVTAVMGNREVPVQSVRISR